MRAVALAVVLAAATNARAQIASGSFDGLVYGVMAADIGFGLAGATTGAFATRALLRGDADNGWYKASLGMGLAQLGMSGLFLYGAVATRYDRMLMNPYLGAIAAGHLAVGLWNVVVGFAGLRPRDPGKGVAVQPTVVHGRGSVGNRFTGLGVLVSL